MTSNPLTNFKKHGSDKSHKSTYQKNSNVTKTSFCKVVAWVILLVFTPIGGGLIALIIDNSPIDNFLYYQQLVSTIIAGIFGLLIVITMFYLGKMHDYDKNFIQVFSENKHLKQVFDNLFKILSSTIESVEKKSQNSNDNKIQPINNHLTLMKKYMDDLAKSVDFRSNLSESSEKSKNRLTKSRQDNFNLFIGFLVYFAAIFFIFSVISNATYGVFLYFFAALISGFLCLLILWYLNERTMNNSHSHYKMLLNIHVSFDNDIFWLKYYIKQIQDIDEDLNKFCAYNN